MRALKRLMLKTTAGPTFSLTVVHGPGGVGKSTLAQALALDKEVLTHFPDGTLWVSLGLQPNVLSLLRGWISALGDYGFRTTAIETASGHLRSLLADRAFLLVVDDVWDLKYARDFQVGGADCAVLFTTRDALIAKAFGVKHYDLPAMEPKESLKLLSGRLGRALKGKELAEATLLSKDVGHLPLALELAAAQIHDGIPWNELRNALTAEVARLEALSSPGAESIDDETERRRLSLRACFHVSVQRLPEEMRPRFTWLGVLPDDVAVTAELGVTLWDLPSLQAARDTLRLLRDRALISDGPPAPDHAATYRIHDLLLDHARWLLANPAGAGATETAVEATQDEAAKRLESAHALLLDRYYSQTQEGAWHTLPDDGYIHAHLTWHMEKASLCDAIHDLMCGSTGHQNAWYQARESVEPISGFVEDVSRAWRLTECVSLTHVANCRKVTTMGQESRYALLTASLSSLAVQLPPGLSTALVKHGIWPPSRAVAEVCRNPDWRAKTKMLTGLWPYLPSRLVPDAFASVRMIPNENGRWKALWDLAPDLPESLLKDAVATARAMDNAYYRASCLVALAPRIADDERDLILAEALEAAQDINKSWKLELLKQLPLKLSDELAHRAVQIACDFHDHWLEMNALAGTMSRLPECDRHSLISRLWEALITGEVPGYMLGGTLPLLIPHLPESSIRKVQALAATIENRYERVQVLAMLVQYLPESERRSRLAELLIEIQEAIPIHNGVPDVVFERIAPVLPDALLEELLNAVCKIQPECSLVTDLRQLVPHLSEGMLQRLLQVAATLTASQPQAELLLGLAPRLTATMLAEALAVARRILQFRWRVFALVGLAGRLGPTDRLDVVQEAWETARQIALGPENTDRADALTCLVDLVPDTQRTVLLDEALNATRTIEDHHERAKTLLTMVSYLPEQDPIQLRLLPHAFAAISLMSSSNRANFLWEKLLPRLAVIKKGPASEHAPFIALALRDAVRAQDYSRADLLAALAAHLTPSLLNEAIQAAWSIKDENAQMRALTGLVLHVSEGDRPDLLRTIVDKIWQMSDAVEKVNAIVGLVIRAQESDRSLLLDHAQKLVQSADESTLQALGLVQLLPFLPKTEHPPQVCQIIRAASGKYSGLCSVMVSGIPKWRSGLHDDSSTVDIRVALLALVAPFLREVNFEEAVEAALAFDRSGMHGDPLVEIIPWLPVPGQVLKKIQALPAGVPRARNLLGLIPYLDEANRPDVMKQALAEFRDFGPVPRARALTWLTPHLPPKDRLPLLEEALVAALACDGPGRAALLADLTTIELPEAIRSRVVQETLKAVQSIEDPWYLGEPLTKLGAHLQTLPTATLYPYWRSLLHSLAARARGHLLTHLRIVVPIIAALGGPDAVADTANAIMDVGTWWSPRPHTGTVEGKGEASNGSSG